MTINGIGKIHDTLEEIGQSSLEVEITYKAYAGEEMVLYYPDGSGYPGSPPWAELLVVRVVKWCVIDEERSRGAHWIWNVLDGIAQETVENDWNRFEELCLDDIREEIADAT